MKAQVKGPKISWVVQFASPQGGTAYVKEHGKLFVFVSTQDQATEFLSLSSAEEFAARIKRVNRFPNGVKVVVKSK